MATTTVPKKEKAPETPIELRLVREVFGNVAPRTVRGSMGVAPVTTTNDDLLCGIELEIENLPEGIGWYSAQVGDFWDVDEDGSLRPRGQAWEFISHPARMAQMVAETATLFSRLNIREERNYSDRCSVHIHTNVQDWTQQQVASLALVYPVFEAVLFQFVNHYKKRDEQGYCRDTNLYCIPWSDCRHNRNFVENLFTNPGNVRNWQKYTALNFLPILDKGTVEWRHMHGTCDMEKLTIWFNVIGAIMKFCKENEFHGIVATIQALNDVSTYQQFFEQVLQRQLPYNEDYRRLMAEGVINAKYSLINWEANKDKPKTAKKAGLYDWATVDLEIPDPGAVPDGGWWGTEPATINTANRPDEVAAGAVVGAGARIRDNLARLEREARTPPPAPRDPLARPVLNPLRRR